MTAMPTTNLRHRLAILAAALIVVCATIFFCTSRDTNPSSAGESGDSTTGVATSTATSQVAVSDPARTAASKQSTTITISNPGGQRLPEAQFEIDDEEGVAGSTDSAGTCVLEFTGERTLRVSKRGYRDVSQAIVSGEDYDIVLPWNLECSVEVMDDQGRAMPNVTVWLGRKWLGLEELRGSEVPSAITDASGQATIDGLDTTTLYVHAYHPTHLVDTLQTPVLTITPGPSSRARIVMTPLLVFAYQPGEIEILAATQRCAGGFSPPNGSLAKQVVQEAKAALTQRFPGSVSYFSWRRANAKNASCELLVVPAGRLPFRLPALPVPLADFAGPIEVGAANSPHSNEFGTLVITTEGADPAAFAGVTCQVVRETTEDLDPKLYAGLQMTRALGESITLPVGRYRLRTPQMGVLDSKAIAVGIVTIARGEVTRVRLSLEHPLYPVTLQMRTEDGEHLRDCQLSYSCPAFHIRVSEVILSPDVAIVRWLPEGVFEYRIRMAGPSNFETYLGTGSFTALTKPTTVDVLLTRQKG